jgi:hypothetical protein
MIELFMQTIELWVLLAVMFGAILVVDGWR